MSNERSREARPGAPAVGRVGGALGRVVKEDREPLILGVDTATETRSVAVARGGQLLAVNGQGIRESHAANILGDIDAALRRAAVGLTDVDLFGVAKGPGSFTGLRAGLATIKAFSATLGRPVVGVPTLHAIARAARPARRLWAMITAGRGEVFAQLLSVSQAGEVEELEEAVHINPAALIERQQNSLVSVKWAGGGARASASLIDAGARAASLDFTTEEAGENFTERDEEGSVTDAGRLWTLARPVEILAEHVAALALQSYRAGLYVRAADLRAHYVRASDAELNERWRSQQSLRK